MEFAALNVDFSSSSPDPLGSRRPSHAGLDKRSSFYRLQIDIESLFAITITADKLLMIQH